MKRRDDPTDKDWMSLTQITLFIDELVGYLKENLRVYTREDGRIDYLSLANDIKIFSQKNKRRVRESLSVARGDMSNRDSSLSGASGQVRMSVDSSKNIRVTPKLSDKLERF